MLPASLSAKWLPRDFVEASLTGGFLTVVAYAVMFVVFVLELKSYFSQSMHFSLLLDHDSSRDQMQVNVDFDMFGVDCQNLNVMVIDQERNEPVRSFARELRLRSIGGTAESSLQTFKSSDNEEDEHERLHQTLEQSDGKAELDSDWADSHDGFKHKSFEHVIQFHDFTLINFFAGWCVHCQQFAPMWNQLATQLGNVTFEDRDGKQRKVTAIKMNCVDFQEMCQQQGIAAFPTIRLYQSSGKLAVFKEHRSIEKITSWVEMTVKMISYGWNADHKALHRGCSVRGFLKIPRVPGRLEFMAGKGNQNLQPTMTNVSHVLRHLSFKDPGSTMGWRLWAALPPELTRMSQPIDGKVFTTQEAHETWEHHLRIVTAKTSYGTAYQFVHYGRRAKVDVTEVPQVRFHFDFEPFAIEVTPESKRWYDLVTSLLAGLGGLFALFRVFSRGLVASGRAFSDKRSGGLVR